MVSRHFIAALAAAGTVAAQKSCTGTTTINSQAEATPFASCTTFKGTVVIGPDAGPILDLSGPGQITGDLEVKNNTVLQTLESTDLNSIGGSFTLNGVRALNQVTMPSLTSVKSLEWQVLPVIDSVTLGPITEADSVQISDTFLQTLDGIDLHTVDTMLIDNNKRLTEFESQLGNLSTLLTINANGINLKVNLPNLIWINEMKISNVTEFLTPSLVAVNKSAHFDSNYFEEYSAPNLTSIKNDISFVGNSALANISFPLLQTLGGGLQIANNTAVTRNEDNQLTALKVVDGFPKLRGIGGAVKLTGNFTEVEFPALIDVKGAFDLKSTEDIEDSCKDLRKKKSDGEIQGEFNCESDNERANEDVSNGGKSGGGGSGGGSDDGDDDSAASGLGFNTALLGLALFGALSQVLL